jgi:hypothetical protein
MLRVPHLDHSFSLLIGQGATHESGVLLVEGATEQTEVVPHLRPDHVLFAILLEFEHDGLLAVRFAHFRGLVYLKKK